MTGDLLHYITTGLDLGIAGFVLWLFIAGKLHSDREFTALVKEKEAANTRAEHLQEALRLADQRAELGTMAAQIVASAMSGQKIAPQVVDHD